MNLKVIINYSSKAFWPLCAVIFIFANPDPDFLTDKDKIDAIRHGFVASVNICRIRDECKKSKKKKDS